MLTNIVGKNVMKRIDECKSESYETIVCPVCEYNKFDDVYQCYQETGDVLGRVLTSFVVCNDCGFMFQNPRPRLDIMMKYYAESNEASGAIYHDTNNSSLHSIKQKSRRDFFSKHLDKNNSGCLLEVGCSTGDYLLSLDLKDWHLSGLEPSSKAARLAKNKGVTVICSTLEESDLSENYYDVISCFSVLEHLYDIDVAMMIITNALKEGGLLFLEVPDTMKPTPQVAEFFTFEHMSHFTKETLVFFLENYGYGNFEIDDTVGDSRIRICAKKISNINHGNDIKKWKDKEKLANARNMLITQICKYKEEKELLEQELSSRISSVLTQWKKSSKKIAVYGAGIHTRYLLSKFDISEDVIAILDSDPGKQGKKYLRWIISDEKLLENGEVDAVIISSKVFEDEIYNRIKKYAINHGVEIIRCYKDNKKEF